MGQWPVSCAACGAELPRSYSDPGVERQPCPECGASGIFVAVTQSDTFTIAESVDILASAGNEAAARRRALEASLADVEIAVDANSVSDAQSAIKRALEAIHELNDCLRRNEWAQVGWDADELGLWHAYIGARNAAHHTSSPVVALHSPAMRDDRLRWHIEPTAIASLRFPRQRDEYLARLDNQAVLPSLRSLTARVSGAIP